MSKRESPLLKPHPIDNLNNPPLSRNQIILINIAVSTNITTNNVPPQETDTKVDCPTRDLIITEK
jgi:hypothetical protein